MLINWIHEKHLAALRVCKADGMVAQSALSWPIDRNSALFLIFGFCVMHVFHNCHAGGGQRALSEMNCMQSSGTLWKTPIKDWLCRSSPGLTGRYLWALWLIVASSSFFPSITVVEMSRCAVLELLPTVSAAVSVPPSRSSPASHCVSSAGPNWRVPQRKSPSPCLCGTCGSACWCVRSGGVSSWGWTPASGTAANWLFSPRQVSDSTGLF